MLTKSLFFYFPKRRVFTLSYNIIAPSELLARESFNSKQTIALLGGVTEKYKGVGYYFSST